VALEQTVAAIALMAAMSPLNAVRAQGQQEVLWVMKYGTPHTLYMIDPASGQELAQNAVTPVWGYPFGMTFDGAHLFYAENLGASAFVFAQTSPFGGQATQVTSTVPAFSPIPSWCGLDPEFDPISQAMYVAARNGNLLTGCPAWLYRLDPITGIPIAIGPITPGHPYAASVPAFAIDPAGNALVIRLEANGQGVYKLDLSSATATSLGSLPLLGGGFDDLAFTPGGQLFGVFSSNVGPQSSTIYHIDVQNLSAHPIGGTVPFSYSLAAGYMPKATTYCVAKVNSLGCTPTLSVQGIPSPSLPSGFVIKAGQLRNRTAGLLFYGSSGAASIPFQGGVLCVASPIKRTPPQNSGGSPSPLVDCTGEFWMDFNQFAVGNPALAIPGTTVCCQWWGRDPGFAPPFNTALTQATRYVVTP
jgi:hypothetical protein